MIAAPEKIVGLHRAFYDRKRIDPLERNVIRQAERGDEQAVASQMRMFIKEVKALIQSRKISKEAGRHLIDAISIM